jgi:hypothetical protein
MAIQETRVVGTSPLLEGSLSAFLKKVDPLLGGLPDPAIPGVAGSGYGKNVTEFKWQNSQKEAT